MVSDGGAMGTSGGVWQGGVVWRGSRVRGADVRDERGPVAGGEGAGVRRRWRP